APWPDPPTLRPARAPTPRHPPSPCSMRLLPRTRSWRPRRSSHLSLDRRSSHALRLLLRTSPPPHPRPSTFRLLQRMSAFRHPRTLHPVLLLRRTSSLLQHRTSPRAHPLRRTSSLLHG